MLKGMLASASPCGRGVLTVCLVPEGFELKGSSKRATWLGYKITGDNSSGDTAISCVGLSTSLHDLVGLSLLLLAESPLAIRTPLHHGWP